MLTQHSVTHTDFQNPHVSQATSVHPAVDQQPGSHGDGGVALTGGGCGAVKDRTLPLQTSALTNLQIAQVIQVPGVTKFRNPQKIFLENCL